MHYLSRLQNQVEQFLHQMSVTFEPSLNEPTK